MPNKILKLIVAAVLVLSPFAVQASILGIQQGGTATSTFVQGWIYSDGLNRGWNFLQASSSPTVARIVATSSQPSLFPNASTTLQSFLGSVFDIFGSQGTSGNILMTTNTGTKWVATTTFNSPLVYSNGAVSCSTCNTSGATVSSVTLATPASTLTLGGTNPVTTTGTINADLNLAHSNTWTVLQIFSSATTTAQSVINELNIPSGTAPLIQTVGDLAVDTTAGQLKYHDGITTEVLSATTSKAFNLASTTLDAIGKSFNFGTSTFLLANMPEPMTLVGFYCTASTTGTALVRFGDNTNWTETGSCSSGSFTKTSTNVAFPAFGPFVVQASSTAGIVNRITVTAVLKVTSQ